MDARQELERLRAHVADLERLLAVYEQAADAPDPSIESIVKPLHAGERFLEQESALLSLTQSETLQTTDLGAALRQITETAARTLAVDRVSIWRYSQDRRFLSCVDLYERRVDRHSGNVNLAAELYPSYFEALATSRIIAADDAHRDPRTREFSETYLSPHGITSMMDVPIHLFGTLEGVLCHEHVGPVRRWMEDEQMFAMAVANLVSLVYHQEERRRIEAAYRESERRFRDFMDHSHAVAWMKDEEGRYVYVNRVLERSFGMRLQEWKGRTDFEVFPVEIARQFREGDLAVLRTGTAVELSEITTGPDGGIREWWVLKFPFQDESGTRYVGGMAIEITDRRRAERALRESEERLRIALDAVRMGIWDWDLRTNSVTWSDNVRSIFGLAPDAFDGTYEAYLKLIHPDDRDLLKQAIVDCREGRKPYAIEHRIVRPDGVSRWIACKGDVLRDEDGKAVRMLGTVVDVTERKGLEGQLLQAQKMEAVGRLAGGIAYDFNNLLTVINGYSQLALASLGPHDPLRRELEGIKQAGDRATDLTNRLLTFSRRQVTQPKVLDVDAVVTNLMAMLQRLIGEHIRLAVRLQANSVRVKYDPGHLEQILVNLAVNARDAMPAGGTLTIETSAVPKIENDGLSLPSVQIVVRDTGCGMDAETRSHLFEPFFTTKDPGKGTGLGLAMVYGIVTQNGGTIEVESAPGQGTAFKIGIPAVEAADEAVDVQPSVASACGGTETILLAEDESIVRRFIYSVLTQRGYRILEAATGDEAARCSSEYQGTIDLLLTDVVMPGMNGAQLAERIAAARPGIKVLFISGYTEETVFNDRLRRGAEFLQKPMTPDVLLAKVRELLDAPLEGPR